MKKLSHKHKLYLLRKSLQAFQKYETRKLKKSNSIRSSKEDAIKRKIFVAPEYMDLEDHYESTVHFFHQLRTLCEDITSPFKIDFTKIHHLSPAAALIFTAEIDRIVKIRARKGVNLSVRDFEKWDTSIKLQLRDMGMFDLLRPAKIPGNFWTVRNATDEQFLKFQSGNMINGEDANTLNMLITNLTPLPSKKLLQVGLTEAMSNSLEHAYPEDTKEYNKKLGKRWWMSASFNNLTKRLSVLFYDEGIGIPKSLKKTLGEHFSSIFGQFNAGKLIEAATELQRTRTHERNRGKGLKDIKKYIETIGRNKAQLEIHSLNGYYKYSEKVITKEFTSPINGTLIQWQINLMEVNNAN